MADASKLIPRKTTFGGQTYEDDWTIFTEQGDSVGRILKAPNAPQGKPPWEWHINPPFPIPPDCNGHADTLDDAKGAFKRAWIRFRGRISDREWERTMKRYRKP